MGYSNIKTTEGYVHENTRMIMKGQSRDCLSRNYDLLSTSLPII